MRYTGPKLRILRRLNIEKLPGLTTKSVRVGSRNFIYGSLLNGPLFRDQLFENLVSKEKKFSNNRSLNRDLKNKHSSFW